MADREICVVNVVLTTIGILLLLGAAFDILPISDNFAIFLAIACFIIGQAIKRILKGTSGGTCCK